MGKSGKPYGFWRRHVEDWRASDLGQEEYCRKHDLSMAAFNRTRRRMNYARKATKAEVVSLVPITVNTSTSPSKLPGIKAKPSMVEEPIEIRLIGGRSIVVKSMFDESKLGSLIRFLEALPC